MKKTALKILHPLIMLGTALIILVALIISLRVSAEGTVTVSGNTSTGGGQPGWLFSRDLLTSSPYSFVHDKSIVGIGSLYAGPITNTNYSGALNNDPNKDMFTAEFYPGPLSTADFHEFSFNYQLGAGSDSSDVGLIVTSIYANVGGATSPFECRYDYFAKSTSPDSFSRMTVYGQDSPSNIQHMSGGSSADCPQTVLLMPQGSSIRAFAITMGNVTGDDTGLSAYFDNVVLTKTDMNFTAYDFEPKPRTKEDCAGDKWKSYKFRNQGQCIKSI